MARINVNYTTPAMQGQMDLNLLFFGMEECAPGHTWGPGLRDSYVLHYIHSGHGVFRTTETIYKLGPGQGFILMPDTLVHYSADEADPWTYSWIGFKGLNAKSLLLRAQISADRPIFTELAGSGFSSFYEELNMAGDERGSDVLRQSILYRIFADLIRCSPEQDGSHKPQHSREGYIRRSVEYIESSYSQKVTVLDIARSVGLDRTYLSGLFKDKFGVSLQTFLLEYRMSRATDLLRNPELSVSDVSRSVGYNDPFLFSKMFKKVVGSSPKQYRETQL
ncbi:helix-turn-helix domain-containing protein [Paenibacillus sp. HJL G12]|uniref:Helix-turn-helix domain-containing protein n=1 Tax=Paenibacillus dendrobii TaxID=2691084 RepID=A0A7X3IMC4_9BACL|nr:AraC family transcriptional regulator [Paenibacillus dendrobii]MWV46006.1 helix-turn-helix domain-containing protein [Paenibacillus dendrobii]